MLFSNDDVANFVNRVFEPAWEPVREVPIVHIDFGGGRVLTRTLHGNIATYVCSSDGLTLDILPGIYEPKTYLDRLDQFAMLHRWQSAARGNRVNLLKGYHDQQAKALASGAPAPRITNLDITKYKVERSAKFVLLPGARPEKETDVSVKTDSHNDSTENLAGWKALAEDTRINEAERRQVIHKRLAEIGMVAPSRITNWLYREVLHADLDDPYLGLGEVLFANYPFRAEDAR